MISRELKDSLRNIPTPCYLYDIGLLHKTLEELVRQSGKYGYRLHYALKANYDQRLLEIIRSYGLGTDCVSGNEVKLSVASGFPADGIVFAGVGKSDQDIKYALSHSIFAFNCESREELTVIDDLAGECGKIAKVALRINPDVDPLTHRYTSTGQGGSKFGISYKEIDEVIGECTALKNIDICGLHFHIGSQITQLEVFEYLARRVNNIYKWFTEKGLNIRHVNLGGGLGIDYLSPENNPVPDFETYFGMFSRNLVLPVGTEIHFELGRSVVGQCGELISRVLYTKTNAAGKRIIILDAGMSELIRPALYGAVHSIENLDAQAGHALQSVTVAGNSCESSDIFVSDIDLPPTKRGDLITIKSAGAYGSAMSSRYNLHDLPASVYSDEL